MLNPANENTYTSSRSGSSDDEWKSDSHTSRRSRRQIARSRASSRGVGAPIEQANVRSHLIKAQGNHAHLHEQAGEPGVPQADRIANNRNIEFTSRSARPHAFVTTPRRGLRAGAAVLVVAAPAPLSLIQHGLPEPSRFQAGRRRAAVKTGLRHCTQGAPTEACA